MAQKPGGYHHGDLRKALISEGLEVTRSAGPSALSLRDVARRTGVTPAACYRHFRDRAALMSELSREIQERMAQQMRARIEQAAGGARDAVDTGDAVDAGGAFGVVGDAAAVDPVGTGGPSGPGSVAPVELVARAENALNRLRGVGLGYIDFAVQEPGWFELTNEGDADQAGVQDMPPFAELLGALDECVATGALSPVRRAGAEFSCWAAVHGCAELMVHGPLRGADPQVVRDVAERAVDDIIRGIR